MRRVPRAGLIVVAATGLVAGAAPAASATTHSGSGLGAYGDQKLHWGTCPFDPVEGAHEARCALVTVPRDWANPAAGVDLQVQISRVTVTGNPADRKGAVLTNPGGPGGQGSSLAGMIAALEPKLNKQYAIIGMDPRGTGQEGGTEPSQLGYRCKVPTGRLPQGPLDARDRSRHSIRAHLKTPRAIAEACQSNAVAPYITTWQTVHDMNLIRHLLDEPKLNYLGYSYGTWLGAKYASLFPRRTGRVVLDSSVNWQGRLLADFAAFPRIDQRQFERVYLPWAARRFPEVLGPTVKHARKVYEKGRKAYAKQGLSPDTFDTLFVGNGSEFQWLLSVEALVAAATDGDQQLQTVLTSTPPPLRSQLNAISKQAFGVPAAALTMHRIVATDLGQGSRPEDYLKVAGTRYSVACGDQRTPGTGYYKRLSDRQGPRWPLFGWLYGLSEVCGPWTIPPQHRLPTMPRTVQDNVMVVQGEFDPQTAYEQAMAAVRRAPGVSVLRVDDAAFHGQYALRGNPCVDGVVNTYLLFGSKTNATLCPSVPLPGEDTVHPIPGPVREQPKHAVTQATAKGSGKLRQHLAQYIAKSNFPHAP